MYLLQEDIDKIREMNSSKNVLQLVADSIMPSVLGLEEIKEAIALQIFGSRRGPINILLIGDPGTCCWHIVESATDFSPDSCIAKGKNIVSMMSGHFLIGIPELSRVPEEDALAIHEYAKVSMGQASLIAASAPTYGRFDPYIPIGDQIAFNRYALPLFDLVFALRDVPNPEKDKIIADSILDPRNIEQGTGLELLEKYVIFARRQPAPKLTDDAKAELKGFYLMFRKRWCSADDPIPMSSRQLISMLKLAEASARARLDDRVTKEDVTKAINIMSFSLRQLGFDPETGKIDINRFEGRTVSTGNARENEGKK